MTIDQVLFTIVATGANSIIFFGFGYLIGYNEKERKQREFRKLDRQYKTNWSADKPIEEYDPIGGMSRTVYGSEPKPPGSIFSDEPSGPIQRPSAAELIEMNKPDSIKEAEAAVAETLRNAEEPRI